MSSSRSSTRLSVRSDLGTIVESLDEAAYDDEKKEVFVEIEVSRTNSTTSTAVDQEQPDDCPDGGLRAWLVVLGATSGTFATYGLMNSWGVFQAYYSETLLSNQSTSQIAWIGSTQVAIGFIPGFIMGKLFDRGKFRLALLIASLLYVAAICLVAECKTYWQFLLCQGFAAGCSIGAILSITLAVVPQWFHKRKGIAYGVISVGSSFGGLIIPILVRTLIPKVGFQWTMRILALIIASSLVLANLTLARRLPPKPRDTSESVVNFHHFKNPAYATYTAAAFFIFLTMYTMLTYIDVSAVSVGIDPNFAIYLVSIANAVSCFTRVGGGFLVDRYGALNVIIPATFSCGVATFVWPFLRSRAGFAVIAALYGLTSGVFGAMFAAPLTSMGSISDIGERIAMVCVGLALGELLGPPISGTLNTATGAFFAVGLYAGSAVMIAVGLLILTKYFVLGSVWGRA